MHFGEMVTVTHSVTAGNGDPFTVFDIIASSLRAISANITSGIFALSIRSLSKSCFILNIFGRLTSAQVV